MTPIDWFLAGIGLGALLLVLGYVLLWIGILVVSLPMLVREGIDEVRWRVTRMRRR